jgi:hypothetical protein
MPSDPIKIDLAYKKFTKRQYTTTQKRWHEEFPGKSLNIKMKEIWGDTIPINPPVSSTSIVEVISDLVLTHDATVENNRSWLACSTPGDLNTRLGDFIQPDELLSSLYYVKLTDDSGTQIFVGDPINFEFDYGNGILTFEFAPSIFTPPFHIDAYRYIGVKGISSDDPANITPLDQAYDGPSGDGSGRIINVDFGPVQFSASSGSAALQIDPVTYTPATGLADGQIINRAGILYIYDSSRTKWLSMNRTNVVFGIKRADGCFLNVGDFTSTMSGWPAMRDGTVTGITVQASGGYASKAFSMSINNDPTPVYSFSLAGHYHSNGALNIDFDANDVIKILTSSENPITHNVIANVEICWRT